MRYGRLQVQAETRRTGRGYYHCLCDCGKEKTVRADNVRAGLTTSCGCLSREKASSRLRRVHTDAKGV